MARESSVRERKGERRGEERRWEERGGEERRGEERGEEERRGEEGGEEGGGEALWTRLSYSFYQAAMLPVRFQAPRLGDQRWH